MFSFPFLKKNFTEKTVELSKQFPFTDSQKQVQIISYARPVAGNVTL